MSGQAVCNNQPICGDVASSENGAAHVAQRTPELSFQAFSLPKRRPMPIEPLRADREWMGAGNAEFANRCLPLRLANQSGWALANPLGFQVAWDGTNELEGVRVTQQDEPGSLPVVSHFGYGILTWHIPFIFRLPAGWNLRVRGPVNDPKDAISPLEGIVEADWSVATFTMNWKFTRPSTVEFKRGEIFSVLVPEKTTDLEQFAPVIRELSTDAELANNYRAWASSRHNLLQQRESTDWEKHYFKGTHPAAKAGWSSPGHRTHLKLSSFSDETVRLDGES